jgi:hypothetical protein
MQLIVAMVNKFLELTLLYVGQTSGEQFFCRQIYLRYNFF